MWPTGSRPDSQPSRESGSRTQRGMRTFTSDSLRKGGIMRGKGYRLRRQGIIFGLVGLSGTVLNTGLVYVLHGHLRWPLPLAVALGSELAILNNYLWNDRWTFGRSAPSLRRF